MSYELGIGWCSCGVGDGDLFYSFLASVEIFNPVLVVQHENTVDFIHFIFDVHNRKNPISE